MPLHDWTDRTSWEGLHIFWMTEIVRSLRTSLPAGYRALLGSNPAVAIGSVQVKPDVAVTSGTGIPSQSDGHPLDVNVTARDPDVEVAVTTLDEDTSVQVERDGRLVAAVELISPRNKDRPAARDQYAVKYLRYLRGGVHLLLVDVHRRPLGFSFPQLVAESLGEALPAPPTPSAVVYRVGEPAATGGRMLAVWQYPLAAGDALPTVLLSLTLDTNVPIDLDGTYARAAADAYVE